MDEVGTKPSLRGFNLGGRVSNNGYCTAHDLRIESAQPKIKENELGLLVGFEITGATVNGSATSSSLLVDFGDIVPDTSGTAVGSWSAACPENLRSLRPILPTPTSWAGH
ncbi:hypothetical protein [Desulfosarcina ovata]|uniref:Uncharacterized protein n=1 Tax=Desulfosarcina ovata subsp. ovata TaxID=2752305 RepID=A0A5K8AJ53_9BACT|nr:hypothetical protein [Desulfosarcina ovata]BBO92723.1 hypothetical protein DSCOOX_59030 [Desulfosarcina ovata subsp. ovata]